MEYNVVYIYFTNAYLFCGFVQPYISGPNAHVLQARCCKHDHSYDVTCIVATWSNWDTDTFSYKLVLRKLKKII
jgi:hypothetical protein